MLTHPWEHPSAGCRHPHARGSIKTARGRGRILVRVGERCGGYSYYLVWRGERRGGETADAGSSDLYGNHAFRTVGDLCDGDRVASRGLCAGKHGEDVVDAEVDSRGRAARVNELPEFAKLVLRGDEIILACRDARVSPGSEHREGNRRSGRSTKRDAATRQVSSRVGDNDTDADG